MAIMDVPVQEEEQVRQALDEVASRVAGAAPAGLFQQNADSMSTLALQQAALHEVSWHMLHEMLHTVTGTRGLNLCI